MYKRLFTSESVGAGHPDKICDQISDAVLDKILSLDFDSRVACEVMVSNRLIVVGGEISTSCYVDIVKIAWEILFNLGYNENDFTVISNVNSQSPNIKQGVDKKDGHLGAGDQGLMFGYAINETKELMPLPITLAHELAKRAEKLRKNGQFAWAKSDLKSQVTIDYSQGKPRIDTILMSVQHEEKYNQKEFFNFIKKEIMQYVVKEYKLNNDFKILINPTGKFIIGGPIGDTGLTGRKIIVDTYGGKGHHGGGAFSGKDYTKVDRSAAYAARWVAKNVVAAGLADECEVQISYAIGIEKPVSIAVETFNTGKVNNIILEKCINKVFNLSLDQIIKDLELKKPIYLQTAVFGHFGRKDLNLSWEKLNKVKDLQLAFKEITK